MSDLREKVDTIESFKEDLRSDITYHSHPYITCPICGEEFEVEYEGSGMLESCPFCHAKDIRYTTEI